MFLAAPVIRTVPRIEFPSTKQPTMAARFSVLSRFMLTIMRGEPDGISGVFSACSFHEMGAFGSSTRAFLVPPRSVEE